MQYIQELMSPQVMFVIYLFIAFIIALYVLSVVYVFIDARRRGSEYFWAWGLLALLPFVGLIAYNVLRPNTYLADREEQELDMALRERQLAQYGTCPHCGGRGTVIKEPCKTCRGTGMTGARKTLEVRIPAGIDDDQNIALRGQGDAGSNGGPAGDVIVHVTVRPDPIFQRDGYDVTVRVPITFSQAVLGDDVEVPTVDGRVVQHIPEGTQSGTRFRLRGQGIQYLNGRGRGDQYVIVDVEIPKKLTRAQREALKAFDDSLREENYEKRKGFFKNLRDRFAGN